MDNTQSTLTKKDWKDLITQADTEIKAGEMKIEMGIALKNHALDSLEDYCHLCDKKLPHQAHQKVEDYYCSKKCYDKHQDQLKAKSEKKSQKTIKESAKLPEHDEKHGRKDHIDAKNAN